MLKQSSPFVNTIFYLLQDDTYQAATVLNMVNHLQRGIWFIPKPGFAAGLLGRAGSKRWATWANMGNLWTKFVIATHNRATGLLRTYLVTNSRTYQNSSHLWVKHPNLTLPIQIMNIPHNAQFHGYFCWSSRDLSAPHQESEWWAPGAPGAPGAASLKRGSQCFATLKALLPSRPRAWKARALVQWWPSGRWKKLGWFYSRKEMVSGWLMMVNYG